MSYMIYRDSLSRMYGSPGSGKSFVALDLSLSLAAGRFWGGRNLDPETVVYVMAEGQAVNGNRVEAWMSYNHVPIERLDGRFFAVPDAVMLTEHAARPFIDWVTAHQPALVVLDTKNAMMVGDENSASDFATLRRTLDLIRKAASCCVLLIDHTGYEGTRARGSSAGTAAMDTEIRVSLDNSARPALITAEVTRDKAAEAGLTRAWRLVPEHPAAVLIPTDVPQNLGRLDTPDWTQCTDPLPTAVLEYTGPGQKYVATLARLMMHSAGWTEDPARMGMTLAQAYTLVKEAAQRVPDIEFQRDGIRRAWSKLQNLGLITPVSEKTEPTGYHLWSTQ